MMTAANRCDPFIPVRMRPPKKQSFDFPASEQNFRIVPRRSVNVPFQFFAKHQSEEHPVPERWAERRFATSERRSRSRIYRSSALIAVPVSASGRTLKYSTPADIHVSSRPCVPTWPAATNRSHTGHEPRSFEADESALCPFPTVRQKLDSVRNLG